MDSFFVLFSVFQVLRAEQHLTPFTEKTHVLRGSSCGEACMHPHRVTPTERASTLLCQVFPFSPPPCTSLLPFPCYNLFVFNLVAFFPLWVFLHYTTLCLLTRSLFLILLASVPLACASHFPCTTERQGKAKGLRKIPS